MYRGQVAEVSNREDVELFYQLMDEDTDELIDLSTVTAIVASVRDNECERINLSLETGEITLVETDTMRVFISETSMAGLCPGTYQIGITVTNAGFTPQLIAGSMAVVNGIVSR